MVAKSEEENRKLVQAELAKTESQLRASESREEQLQDDLSSKCTEVEKLGKERDDISVKLQTKIDELKSTLSEKETEWNKLTVKCNSYEAQIAEQLDKISKLSEKEPGQGAVQKDLEQEFAQLTEQVEILKNEKAGAEDVLDLKHREVETCKTEIEKLTHELQVHRYVIRRLSDANKEHCQVRKELSLKHSKLRQDYEQMTKRCEQLSISAIDRDDRFLVCAVTILMGIVALLIAVVSTYAYL